MKRILIISGKGGTGKTTTAAAWVQFARAKAVCDCDVDAPNLHLVMGRTEQPERTPFFGGDKASVDPQKCIGCGRCGQHCRIQAISVKDGKAAVDEYACEGCGVCAFVCTEKAVTLERDRAGSRELYTEDGVFSTAVLRMGRGNSGKLVTEVKRAMLTRASEAELAIVDGPPGIGCPVIAAVSGVELVVMVAEPSLSCISDLTRLIETVRTMRSQLAVCINRWDIAPEHTEAIEALCEAEGIPILGRIPYDAHASAAINAGRSLATVDCPAREALFTAYHNMIKLIQIENE